VIGFVDAVLEPGRPFIAAFRPFHHRAAQLGIYNSLAQLLIKITAPGVPDFYQGTELWDLSLVDPDNRRQIDYHVRRELIDRVTRVDGPTGIRELLDRRTDGRLKMFATTRALHARTAFPALFSEGTYEPIGTAGQHRESLFAFARRHGSEVAITCVPRLVARLPDAADHPPVGCDTWKDTRIELPATLEAQRVRDVFTGRIFEVEALGRRRELAAGDLLMDLPFALLVSQH
jgi:(1->4)-alpha-D-glucan 1-alpha-D-glucosylmutase